MQKHKLTTTSSSPRTTLNEEIKMDSDQNPKIANTTKKSISQRKKSESKLTDEHLNQRHCVTNNIRDEILLQHTPPVNSLSELIFLNNMIELEKELQGENDPNRRDTIGPTSSWTPLYWSVKLGRTECVKLLLNYGANINLVINDCEECCGTVLDLAALRGDDEMENLLREFAEREDVNLGQSFKAIRTKLRGKAPAFNFRYYGKGKKMEETV